METYSWIISKDLLERSKDLLIDGNFVVEGKIYDIILGFNGFYFYVVSVVPKDITMPNRVFKFTYSVFSDTISIDIYLN